MDALAAKLGLQGGGQCLETIDARRLHLMFIDHRKRNHGDENGNEGSAVIRRVTCRDILDAPPHKVAEIIDGTLYMNPRPTSRHAWASSDLGASITQRYNHRCEGPGSWWIVFESALHLSEDILVPDRAVVENGCRTIPTWHISRWR